jgi:hypothetical protein
MLPSQAQEPTRHAVAKNIQHLYKQDNVHSRNTYRAKKEHNTVRSIKQKLTKNSAMVVKSGKAIIVVYKQDYQDKVLHFISLLQA